jgi:hypothetical protein
MFADALTGGDINKLNEGMKVGKFKSFDLLKVAQHMKDLVDPKLLAEMLKTAEKQVTRLSNSWLEFMMAMNDSGLWDAIGSGVDKLTASIKELTPHIPRIAEGFKGLLGSLWTAKYLLPIVWGYFKVSSIMAASGGVLTLAGAFKKLALMLLRTVAIPAAILAGILLIADAIESVQGKDGLLMEASRKGGMLGMFAEALLQAAKLLQLLGLIDESQRQKEERKTNAKSTAQSKLVSDLAAIQSNPNGKVGASELSASLRDYAYASKDSSPEMRHQMAERVRRAASPEMLTQGHIPRFLDQLDRDYKDKQAYEQRSNNFQAAGGLSPSPTINITIQNVEPNVSKDWLLATMPSVFGQVASQYIQKESPMFANQSNKGSGG